jgi:hypothetical protein
MNKNSSKFLMQQNEYILKLFLHSILIWAVTEYCCGFVIAIWLTAHLRVRLASSTESVLDMFCDTVNKSVSGVSVILNCDIPSVSGSSPEMIAFITYHRMLQTCSHRKMYN